jgi:predicted Zn-dependent peptidase
MRLNARCAHHVRPPVSQEAAIHEGLLREFDRNKDDNRFVLGQRAYEDGDAVHAAMEKQPERIAALTGAEIQKVAQTYLDTQSYVKVTLMPAGK